MLVRLAKLSFFIFTISVFAFTFFSTAYAEIPLKVGYQGRLKSIGGVAQNGTFTFTIRIYDASSGGTLLHTDTQPGITVTDGYFALQINTGTSVNFNQDLWITTEVNSDGEMTPRVQLASVGTSYTARTVGDLLPTQLLRNDSANTLQGGAANTVSSTTGSIVLQPAGSGTTAALQIGGGGAGTGTPDVLALDVKSTAGDPAFAANGYMYYNASSSKFRCYEAGAWKDCDTTGGTTTLQSAYNNGATITTAGSTDIAYTLTSGNFTASGAGSVNLTPTGASSFTSGGALTLTAGAASTWSTTSGNLNVNAASALNIQGGATSQFTTTAGNIVLQAAGAGTTAHVHIGTGGAGSGTPDLLTVDVKSTAGDPASGVNGAMYYNASSSKLRCFEAGAWKDCDTTGGTTTLQSAYNNGATITTASSTDIAYTLTSGNFTASGAGSVNLTPTGASSFTSGGALTLTGGAASTWKTSSGNLTIDAAATLNLGTTDATGVSIGKTGTTTTVNGPLAIPKNIDFSAVTAPTYQEGRLFYDTQFKSLSYYSEVDGVQMNIGRTLSARAKNLTGVTIPKGSVVYINGVDGLGNITIALAQANTFATAQAAGIVTKDITDGSIGYITYMGAILNLDTSSFTAGSTLYLSATTPGAMTTTRPTAPNYAMSLGVVAISHATLGAIGTSITTSLSEGSFTTGSVTFGNGDGFTAQDNTNFFWDDTNNRLGIGDNTPTASLVVGSGDLFQVFGATGNVTTAGDITLTSSGGNLVATGGALGLQGGAASSFSTTAGAVTLQAAGTGTTSTVQIGAGGAGSTTPDLLGLDVKSDAGDPTGFNGATYYNENTDKFRCYQNGAWKDCDTAGASTLQTAYNNGATITTAGSTDIAYTLTSGNFTASGAGSVNLTPTGASSFTSGGALTLTGGAASTWSTTSGNLTLQAGSGTVSLGSSTNLTSAAGLTVSSGSSNIILQPAGTGATANIQIGAGGAGSTTPDLLGLDVKSDAGDPAGFNGATYYNANSNKFRCYINGSWSDCDTTGGTTTLQSAYNNGATITTAASTDIAYTLTSGNFTASGAGSVNLTPTGASSFTSGGALTLTAGAASTWGTTAGNLTLQPASSGTTATVQIGAGGSGSTTPDLFAVDVKSSAGDPTGFNGAMYYNASSNVFRCYEAGSWKDCGSTGAGGQTLQQTYNNGATITTASSTDLALTLTSGNFTASGAGSVNLTPTGASSFTSGGALTLTGGAASTWGTTSGNLLFQAAGTGTTANIQIGAGGAGSTTPDLFAVDVKSNAGDPTGFNGAQYYNANTNKFRCYENSAWKDCDTAGSTSLQAAYNTGAAITTASATDIAYTLTSGNFTASGAGSVNLTPTGASSFTSGGALTLQGGAASTWKTTAGALTLDAATALNLGTTDATSISLGKSGTVATVNGSLAIPNYVDFTSSSNPSYAEGRMFYDAAQEALSYYNDVSGITMNLGRESWIRVRNTTGSSITDGQAVYINGADIGTGLPTIALAQADANNTSEVIGLATHTIANNSNGYITQFGVVHDLDTSSFAAGDPLYLSASVAGGLTTTRPANPNFATGVGVVVTSHASTGSILVLVGKVREGSYTAGSLSFSGSDGFLKQDNTNLFWDDTNNRLGVGDNTPTASFVVGSGDLFQVFGASGNVTTTGDITLATGGGSVTATGGGLTLQGGAASSFSTTAGAITLQPAGSGTNSTVQIGAGGAGSTTPDLFAVDVKSDAGDPTGFNGAQYYNANTNKFRCYENSAWKDCDTTGGSVTLQSAYNSGATITTSGSTNIALTLTSGNFTASGAGSVNLTPSGASSFTSGGALTLTGGAASTWSTTSGGLTLQGATASSFNTVAGDITLQAAGSGTSAVVQIGADGAGSTTPDLLGLDVKSDAGDPTGTNGKMYYNASTNKFRCYENSAWKDCDTTGASTSLQSAYNGGATITTAGSTNIAYTLTSGNFTASGAGSVNLTPTGASSFTSGGALTLTAGATSTWGTTSGNLLFQAAGTGTTANIQIGAGGAGSTTPDLFVLDTKSTSGDPTGTNGAMYYNENTDKFRCYENGAWKDCVTQIITKRTTADRCVGVQTGPVTCPFSGATATLLDDPDLVFAIGASETWEVEGSLIMTNGNATPDTHIAFTVPSGATLNISSITASTGATSVTSDLFTTSGTSSGLIAITAGDTIMVHFKGIVVNSTNAGNIQVQWAQNSSDSTAGRQTIMRANSYIRGTLVP